VSEFVTLSCMPLRPAIEITRRPLTRCVDTGGRCHARSALMLRL
jgi:hypothetical protein